MTSRARLKTIVTLTPISVQTDSRTFKQASAVSRFGYHSIGVAARPSRNLGDDLSFDLRTVGSAAPTPSSSAEGHVESPITESPITESPITPAASVATESTAEAGKSHWRHRV